MAHIEKRGPGRWRARYRDSGGRELSKTFSRRADAERFLALTEADKAHGSWIDPAAGRTPFGDYARSWQQAQVHRGTTADQVASHLRNHILPAFESRPISSVRPSEVQAWVRNRADVLAPSTVELVYRYLAAIFGAAVRDQLIARSPCTGVKLPRSAVAELRPATTQEVLAIADALPPRYRAIVPFTAGTGLRQGEAFGVVLANLDRDKGELRVDRQVVLRSGHAPTLAPPKTDASFRTIPLPVGVTAVLEAHLADFPAAVDPEHGALVFTTPSGEPIRRNRFGEVWRAAVGRAGVRPELTFHDLRHYYASLLIRHGESVKVVQRRLGHKTAQETLDTYGHLWPDSDDRTRDAVDAELFGAAGPLLAASPGGRPALPVTARPNGEIPRPDRGLEGSTGDITAAQRA